MHANLRGCQKTRLNVFNIALTQIILYILLAFQGNFLLLPKMLHSLPSYTPICQWQPLFWTPRQATQEIGMANTPYPYIAMVLLTHPGYFTPSCADGELMTAQ